MSTRASTDVSSDTDTLTARFRALGEEKRLRILASLSARETCACELTGCCDESQPLLSFHLRTLREAGLVEARRDGRWMYYSLDREALRDLADELRAIADGEARVTACC